MQNGSQTIQKPTNRLVFEWFTSLDRFMKKRAITNILLVTKQSRLVVLKGPVLNGIRKPDKWSGFQMPFEYRTIWQTDTNRIPENRTVQFSEGYCSSYVGELLCSPWSKNQFSTSATG
jgi:hypothetical protein